MDNRKKTFFTCILAASFMGIGVKCNKADECSKKLFVFGDSYVDTGNYGISLPSSSWKSPYGFSFPGKPAGRFSDGRVFTDYIASFMGIRTPVAYRWRNVNPEITKDGVNFASGGAGVFDTFRVQPNLSTQIDQFEKLIKDGFISQNDVRTSIVLVCISGNDFAAFLSNRDSEKDLPAFIFSVAKQVILDLERLHSLGVRKIAVNTMPPFGCFPNSTESSSYTKCNQTVQSSANYYNSLLRDDVSQLNTRSKGLEPVVLDLYKAFMSSLNIGGKGKFENPLKPCCVGVSHDFVCGSVGANNEKKYTVCSQPQKSFFWDFVHPTQNGWDSVASNFKRDIQLLSVSHQSQVRRNLEKFSH